MMFKVLLFGVLLLGNVVWGSDYRFAGKHFLSSYLQCDKEALSDVESLIRAMDAAVESSGATILNRTPYIFHPDGLTIVYTLSESHASIHTYPEHGACFVDLFTCGDHCSAKGFHEKLSAYLKPAKIDAHLFLRDETVREVPLQ